MKLSSSGLLNCTVAGHNFKKRRIFKGYKCKCCGWVTDDISGQPTKEELDEFVNRWSAMLKKRGEI